MSHVPQPRLDLTSQVAGTTPTITAALTALPSAGPRPASAVPQPVRLLEADPDLAVGLPQGVRDSANQALVVSALRMPAGPWRAGPELASAMSVLVTEGFVLVEGPVAGVDDAQILGPGDLVDARELQDRVSGWTLLVPAQVVVLRSGLLKAGQRWPDVLLRLLQRSFDGQRASAEVAAVRALPRVEDRVVRYLGLLAGRWGRVTLHGLTLDLPLTHQLLGRLVGARRPTISLALAQLRRDGRLGRDDAGRWLLPSPGEDWPPA